MSPVCWLGGLFIFVSLSFPVSVYPHGLKWIPWTGIWRQTARSHGRRDKDEVAPCSWGPKMASYWGGIPRAGCQPQSTTTLLGQRPVGVGQGRPPFSSPETAHLHKGSFQRYWRAGLPTDFSPTTACVLNTDQAVSVDCHTHWP